MIKRTNSLLIALALIASTFFITSSQANDKDTQVLKLGCVNWLPYIADSLPNQGLLAELSRSIAKDAGYQLETPLKPWNRVLLEVKRGLLDGSVCMFKTDARQQHMHFVEPPLLTEKTVFFALKSRNIQWQSLDDLRMYRIGLLNGASYHQDEFIQTHLDVTALDSFSSLFRMLAKDRLDLVLVEYHNGISTLQSLPGITAEQFITLSKPYQATSVHIAISKVIENSEEISQRLSQAAKRVINSSTAKELYLKHNLPQSPEH